MREAMKCRTVEMGKFWLHMHYIPLLVFIENEMKCTAFQNV